MWFQWMHSVTTLLWCISTLTVSLILCSFFLIHERYFFLIYTIIISFSFHLLLALSRNVYLLAILLLPKLLDANYAIEPHYLSFSTFIFDIFIDNDISVIPVDAFRYNTALIYIILNSKSNTVFFFLIQEWYYFLDLYNHQIFFFSLITSTFKKVYLFAISLLTKLLDANYTIEPHYVSFSTFIFDIYT